MIKAVTLLLWTSLVGAGVLTFALGFAGILRRMR